MDNLPKPRLILAGDKHNYYLYKKFFSLGQHFDIWGFDLLDIKNYRSLDLSKYKLIIAPIPFTIDNLTLHSPYSEYSLHISDFKDKISENALVVGGPFNFSDSRFIDITKDKEFSGKSLIPSCEEVLKIVIDKSEITIAEAKIVIIGEGLLAERLRYYFKLLGGEILVDINTTNADIIINTSNDLGKFEALAKESSKYSTLLDLSSGDKIVNKKVIKARGLPVKSAPRSMAKFLFESITSEGFLP